MTEFHNCNDLDYIAKQEEVLLKIKKSIEVFPNKNLKSLQELEVSIGQLNNEVKNAKAEDVPSIMYQLNILHSLAEKLSENNAYPDIESPYFGHLQIRQNNKIKDIYIGHCGMSVSELDEKIVDWKRAPIAKVFYQFDKDEDFDLDLEDREVGGQVLDKAVLTVVDGALLRVDRAGKAFVKNTDQQWVNINEATFHLEGGEQSSYGEFGTGRTNFKSADVLSLLDKKQFEIVNEVGKKPLLVIGSAGSGKTTVALYRLAQLIQTRKVFPNQALVLVPNKGLAKLSKSLLEKVNIKKARVQVLQEWLEYVARVVFPKLPKKVSRDAPLYAQLVKRHYVLEKVLDDYIDDQMRSCEEAIKKAPVELWEVYSRYKGLPFLQRLVGMTRARLPQTLQIQAQNILRDYSLLREDLYHIFTGEKYLLQARELSNHQLTNYQCNELKIYQTKRFKGFDPDQEYLTAQGSQGTEEAEVSDSIDEDDIMLLLMLAKKKWGSLHFLTPKLKKMKHLLLDEAQEVHPFELEIISEFIHPSASVSVAGDAAQQIDESQSFLGWEHVMQKLGYEDVELTQLNVSYRSPENITKLAHSVLGPLAPKEAPETTKKGGNLITSRVQHNAHGALELTKSLRDLMTRERRASIAIICSNMSTAKEYYEILCELGDVRLVEDADFSLKPGVDITVVEQIRGLEFDYVIIPDANQDNYGINPLARKRLHLAITRAVHQLWLMHGANPTPLINFNEIKSGGA